MIPDVRLCLLVFIPFAAAAVALLAGRWTGRRTGWLMIAAALSSFGLALSLLLRPADELTSYLYEWIPGLTINLQFLGDRFGLFFASLVSGIGTLVGVYSLNYIPNLPNARVGRYYASLIGFMGAMLGVALADDLILLFVFWEITSITSFMLIGFWYEQDKARKGAMTALQVTGLGGLAMMAGFIMVGNITGTFSIHELRESTDLLAGLAASPLFTPALLLILLGAFTKSAQVPFHFWLPNAMVAPTPVSAYLHSATMVKAGVFLLGRMLPIFGHHASWSPILITFGLITFVYASYQAFFETDLKAILARTTLGALGLITLLYGLRLPDQDALQILNHAAYKGTLFLVVGIVEHATHTRDIRELGGLRKRMPITFLIALLAAWSMAGLPPFLGFAAKESFYGAIFESKALAGHEDTQWLVILGCVVANAITFAVACKLVIGVFMGEETKHTDEAHEAPPGLWVPAAVLVAVAVLLGALAAWPSHSPTQDLVNSLSSDPHAHAHVSLIPTHLPPVVLTLFTITGGILLYQNRSSIESVQLRIAAAVPTAQRVWDELLHGVTLFAEGYSRWWQRGSLRWYIGAIMAFTAGLMLYALAWTGLHASDLRFNIGDAPWYGLALLGSLCVAGITLVVSRSRLQAAVASTATGFLTSLMFVVYRSPDILLTQILIETVSTIFVLLILFYMPAFPKKEPLRAGTRLVNMAISLAVGLAVFLFVLFTTSDTFRNTDNLRDDYLTRSLSEAGGENAVNVIIVDFRAGDTMGEITVLVAVGLLIYGMLRSRRKLKAVA
jgi:NADH:ubiquinone oxidoreductase subunit 5 (subunit L)/multisubunit Na+/H+ antiporter MnhA subunit